MCARVGLAAWWAGWGVGCLATAAHCRPAATPRALIASSKMYSRVRPPFSLQQPGTQQQQRMWGAAAQRQRQRSRRSSSAAGAPRCLSAPRHSRRCLQWLPCRALVDDEEGAALPLAVGVACQAGVWVASQVALQQRIGLVRHVCSRQGRGRRCGGQLSAQGGGGLECNTAAAPPCRRCPPPRLTSHRVHAVGAQHQREQLQLARLKGGTAQEGLLLQVGK